MVRVSLFSAAIAASVLAASTAAAGGTVTGGFTLPNSKIIPGRYIVEMETTAEPVRAEIAAKANDISSVFGNLGIRGEIKQRYGLAFPGVAVQLASDADIDRLRTATGVKRITPVFRHRMDPPHTLAVGRTAVNEHGAVVSLAGPMKQVHNLTDVLAARSRYGLTGKGVKVGVIDSGIDYTHPDLGGCFGPGCRVQYGYDFVAKKDVPEECEGHGTHVAGIIGAQGSEVAGVAPEVTLGAYRVGSCFGEVEESDVVAALERALADQMDVVNISLGWLTRYPWDPVSVAVNNAVRQGLIVVVSNANSGPRLYTAKTPAVASGAIAAGAIDNFVYSTYALAATFGAGEPQLLALNEFMTSSRDDKLAALGARPLVVAKSGDRSVNCTVSNLGELPGKIVLWEQSDYVCGSDAFDSVIAAGAAAFVVPANTDTFGPVVNYTALYSTGIPAAVLPPPTLTKLKDGLARGPVTVSGVVGMRALANPAAGELTAFSSRGPSAELVLKPQVALPGGNIYSTYPVAKGSYAVLSGTSMAAPYTVGLIALYLQQHGKQAPAKVQAALQNAARNTVPRQSGLFDGLDSPANIGSGVVNASVLLDPTTALLTPSQLSLNDTGRASFGGVYVRALTITNNAKTAVTYDLAHEAAIAVAPSFNLTVPERYAKGSASVSFAPSAVSVPAGRSQTVIATIVPPANLDERAHFVYGGWLVAKPRDATLAAVRSVYVGVKGDLSRADVFQDVQFAVNFAGSQPDGTPVFDPYVDFWGTISLSQRYASRRIEVFYETVSGRVAGYIGSSKNVPSLLPSLFQVGDYACSTKLVDSLGYCPLSTNATFLTPGRYRLVVRAQRPFTLAPAANPNAWQTAASRWFFLNSSRPADAFPTSPAPVAVTAVLSDD